MSGQNAGVKARDLRFSICGDLRFLWQFTPTNSTVYILDKGLNSYNQKRLVVEGMPFVFALSSAGTVTSLLIAVAVILSPVSSAVIASVSV